MKIEIKGKLVEVGGEKKHQAVIKTNQGKRITLPLASVDEAQKLAAHFMKQVTITLEIQE